ncbi:MAG TPA: hypothetical protein DCZ94_08280 [Lentisphaeria bacterium]|nr:MAG: hypothetical protein A2X48_19760 [Lentisphaerae bacterium GWF2_49_21]HBC86934.1 hypothetical protein [Lentisphaeria bacterium]
MSRKITIKNQELLLALQQGISISSRPFAKFAGEFNVSEPEILGWLEDLFKTGAARRLGGIFDSKRLGYRSALCALRLKTKDEKKVVSEIGRHNGITHCYLRGWPSDLRKGGGSSISVKIPNLWFTFSEKKDVFEKSLKRFEKKLGAGNILVFPSVKRFKVDVIFFSGTEKNISRRHLPKETRIDKIQFTKRDKQLVRLLQGNLPVVSEPFRYLAEKTGFTEKEILCKLKRWKKEGILRRIALIVRHQKIGFKANAMCVWNVPENRISSIGRQVSGFRFVTHCYERIEHTSFPYNFYAMIYADSWEKLQKLFSRISKSSGLTGGLMLCSLKEYKKTSPVYFSASS